MAGKSTILEQALLQVETLEEAVKANAKGILASTMKQELNDLLKEQEDEDPVEDEKDVEDAEASSDDEETSISEPEAGETPEHEAGETPDEENAEHEFGGDEFQGEETDDDDVLDMTGASEAEVLKVFKAMKPEDGIVVKKDGNTVQFSDDGNDYIIKLDNEEDETPDLDDEELPGEELPGEESNELPDEESDELPDELSEQNLPAGNNEEVVYEIELDEEDEDQPFTEKGPQKGVKKMEAKESVTVTKSVTAKDGQPFEKTSAAQVGKGIKKLQANEQAGLDHPGTPVPGTGNPQTKEPGKGGTKVTQSEKHDGTPPKGTKPSEKKEPGKGGSNAKQVEDHPGTPVKGEGKPIVKEPKEEECVECGDNKIEATEAARTKSNVHGDKGGQNRAGLKSKTKWAAGAGKGSLEEEVEILRTQNGEYKKALILFKDKLNEVAVFNANLAYATRLFTEHSTTKQEKLDILKRFDTVSTITEAKNLYTSIKGELDTKKPIVENISKTPTTSSTEVLSESKAYENPQFKRMKELMSKMK